MNYKLEETDGSDPSAGGDAKKSEQYCYIFGFGSIINTDTHAPWLNAGSGSNKNVGPRKNKLVGQRATILNSFGYRRGWIFRSDTGFTALGVHKHTPASDVNGVLFQISTGDLSGFDQREVGYDRVEVQKQFIKLHQPTGALSHESALNIDPAEPIFIYIPRVCQEANEDHPILQSYVDTVMQGCLEWGGEAMASEFVATTYNWSPFFLNDTPSSRRPWLFRKQYQIVDRILRENPTTHFQDRQHPEEFASASFGLMTNTNSNHTAKTAAASMRGTWSVPRRNPNFTGREIELGHLHAKLTDNNTSGTEIQTLEMAGMGGVGKSQLAAEYCYRFFPSHYGLVIWLRAQSSESIVAGFRQLMLDTTHSDRQHESNKNTDEVIGEIKARLFRSKVTWLLVFDNLEDRSLLGKFVPHGGKGHVLVTTRLLANPAFNGTTESTNVMMLGCFQPSESLELLFRSTNIVGDSQRAAGHELANQLGHLPLALGIAAAYMNRCDVDCSEYLARYKSGDSQRNKIGHEIVQSSLSLSLDAIKNESFLAWEILRLLGWLGPDQITKALVRSLLATKCQKQQELMDMKRKDTEAKAAQISGMHVLVTGILACTFFSIGGRRQTPGLIAGTVAIGTLAVLSVASIPFIKHRIRHSVSQPTAPADVITSPPPPPRGNKPDFFGLTDEVWTILKSYSLLVVKEGKGTLHRLLAQSLRTSQNTKEIRTNLEIGLQVMKETWVFKQDLVDTWQASANVLEHVKALISHISHCSISGLVFEAGVLSMEAGVFSAMALNRFKEAQHSLEVSLDMLQDTHHEHSQTLDLHAARSNTLHELGRVFRYDGNFLRSEDALQSALKIRQRLAKRDRLQRQKVASTLHELGVLEVKKHNLDDADKFLQQALDLRRNLESESPGSQMEAECASTLHQLATVQVARKPPSLDKAEKFLNEALGLNMQIGQRAATLKQLARVAIRRGEFDKAKDSLDQALELYVELYGENAVHINIAAVKFQQGALAFQRDQLDQAWVQFSECLRVRRSVYAYCQGNHLEVSSVLHELGCVALAQKREGKAWEVLSAERETLSRLSETWDHRERIYQARLTNLTWLRKCAKERDDDDEVKRILATQSEIKLQHREMFRGSRGTASNDHQSLMKEALRSRLLAREFALSSEPVDTKLLRQSLAMLCREIKKAQPSPMRDAAVQFKTLVEEGLTSFNDPIVSSTVLKACDNLRDVLRDHGAKVNDAIQVDAGEAK